MNERLENLALDKAFNQLTAAERAEVLAFLTPEAYEQLRAALLAAPALDSGPGPGPELRARLLAQMAGRAGSGNGLNRRIPLWQAAAATALIAAAVWFFQKPVLREVAVPVVQVRTDTVFQEKIVWKERVRWREKTVYRDRVLPVAVAPLPEPPVTPAVPGTSLGAEPALMQFFVQVR